VFEVIIGLRNSKLTFLSVFLRLSFEKKDFETIYQELLYV